VLAIAGGILLAVFVLVFLEPLLKLAVWLFITAFWLALAGILFVIVASLF